MKRVKVSAFFIDSLNDIRFLSFVKFNKIKPRIFYFLNLWRPRCDL